ncbi:MAG: ferritin-like domain-containing protein [Marinibacterium sp.]
MACPIIETSNAAAKAVAPETTLDPAARDALFAALDDEHHAEALYAAVLERHGDVRPFANIIKAERRHAAAIATLMKAYGIPVPKNAYKSGDKPLAPLPETLEALCAEGVEAEVANVRLYDERLIPAVSDHPEIVTVFSALRDASRDRHLPAFQRCAAKRGGVPDLLASPKTGCGKGRRYRNRKEH